MRGSDEQAFDVKRASTGSAPAPRAPFAHARRMPAVLALAPIRLYRRFVSPALPRRCRYEPTCSAYAIDAITELGAVRGAIVAAWRVLRCNPWSQGGWDPVAERTLFRDRGRLHGATVPRETETGG